MGLRFRKSIKLGNLLKLNISKSGLSTTVGKSGASLNIGTNGVYANLSPSIVGVKGSGVSYRKKLVGNPLKFNKTIKDNKESIKKEVNNYDGIINLHKLADNVLNENAFSQIDGIPNLDMLIKGDEDTVEKEIGIFLDNLDLEYPVTCNFELEDKVLYVDLDLPEIEIFKTKGIDLNKEEYAKTIINLGIYLCMNFFNISSYIKEIVMSSYISKRNKDGDLIDAYLYSVKFKRDLFENTNLKELDDTYNFLLKFENRINMSSTFVFKEIKPYDSLASCGDSVFEDVISALLNLGYKKSDINGIIPSLKNEKLSSTEEYIKEALRLLKMNI